MMFDTCIQCGAGDVAEGELYCQDCYADDYEDLECSLCGREYNTADGGEYDTCGECMEEIVDNEDAVR